MATDYQKLVMAAMQDEFGELTQKSAQVLADFDSQALSNEDADRFIVQVVNESVLLQNIRVHRTANPSGDLTKLNVTGPVTEKATENTDSGNTYKPANSSVSFATAKTRSALDITGEVQEDTIEGSGARATILDAIVRQVSNDMEQLAIEGDDSITGTTAEERLLKTNDGWHVQTGAGSGAHRVDAGGLRASYALITEMWRNMPTKWRRDRAKLRWIISPNVETDLITEWASRSTDLGDSQRMTGALPKIHGVDFMVVPLLPEDLAITGTAGSTGTFIWLCDPQNFIYVVQRAITIEWEREPRKDADECTIHMRTDFIIEEEDAIVKAYGVNTDTGVAYYS